MAFNVTFYNFSKKENSTAVPASGGTTYSCVLKDGCSIINPVIKLDLGPASGTPVAFNYCVIPDFNRFYFISDWTSDKGMWYGSLTVDALATYKTAIGAASEMVVRSSDEYDGRIQDNMYPMINNQIFYSRDGSSSAWWPVHRIIEIEGVSVDFVDRGEFIVGLLSYTDDDTSLNGGVNYIGFDYGGFAQFLAKIFGVSDLEVPVLMGVKNVFQGVYNLTDTQAYNLAYVAENPYTDYIDSITWMPVTSHFGDHTLQDLYFGPNVIRVAYRSVDVKEMVDFTWSTSDIPKHPQSAARGSYLNLPPYSEYSLVLPRAGRVNLDPVLLGDYSTLTVDLHIDQVTGQGLYQVYAGDGAYVRHLIYMDYVPIGVTVKIGTNKAVGTSLGIVSTAIGGVQQLLSGNIAGVLQSIGSIERERQSPGSGRIGESGGYNGVYPGYPTLQSHHLYVTDEDNDHNGRPLMRVRTLSDVPGYIVCQHGDIDVACTDSERSAIKRFLEGGFFYE